MKRTAYAFANWDKKLAVWRIYCPECWVTAGNKTADAELLDGNGDVVGCVTCGKALR